MVGSKKTASDLRKGIQIYMFVYISKCITISTGQGQMTIMIRQIRRHSEENDVEDDDADRTTTGTGLLI